MTEGAPYKWTYLLTYLLRAMANNTFKSKENYAYVGLRMYEWAHFPLVTK